MIKELGAPKKGKVSDEMSTQIDRFTDIAESFVEFIDPNRLD